MHSTILLQSSPPPGCCSNIGLNSGSIWDCYGADRLTRNEGSKSIARPPSVSPIVDLERKTGLSLTAGHFFGRLQAASSAHHARRNPLLQRYDARQPSCRRHPNSACGRPNAPQWHPAEAIFHCYCHRGKIINPESANQTTTFSRRPTYPN